MNQLPVASDTSEPRRTSGDLAGEALWGAGLVAWAWTASTDTRQMHYPDMYCPDVHHPDAVGTARGREQPGIARRVDIHPDDRLGVLLAWNEHLFQGTDRFEASYRQRTLAGGWQWLREVGRARERDGGGMALSVVGVTERLTTPPPQQDLTLLARAFDSTADGMCVLTEDCVVLEVNSAFERLLDIPRDRLLGQRVPLAHVYATGPDEPWQVAAQRGSWQGRMKLGGDTDGAGDQWVTLSTLRADDGSISHYVMYASRLAERHEHEEQLRRRANFDQLTGVASRAYFEMRLEDAIEQSKRSLVPMAVLFIDLDRFKQVNDTWGHAAGDELLRGVALRCQDTIRRADLLGRWGGDEFVVLLTRVRRPEDVLAVGRKIRAALLEPIDTGPTSVAVSASIGAALYPRDGMNATDLLEAADAAMYRVKSAGRGEVRLPGNEDNARAAGQLQLETEFAGALEKGEFHLAWQPRFRVRDATTVAVEGVLHWDSAAFGRVPPERYLPLARTTAAGVRLADWVLEQACALLHNWRGSTLAGLRVGVNVWREQLLAPGFVDNLRARLERLELDPRRLEIEISEAELNGNFESALDALRALEAMGVALVLDHYGSGGLTLADLCRLPPCTLKLDAGFVAGLAQDHRAAGVLDAVVTLAHNLRLTMAADGVLEDGQLEHLQAVGCQEVQGALLAAAVSESACSEQLQLLAGGGRSLVAAAR